MDLDRLFDVEEWIPFGIGLMKAQLNENANRYRTILRGVSSGPPLLRVIHFMYQAATTAAPIIYSISKYSHEL